MKVIDLLNKMANGEEVPKKIKFENTIYEYNKERQDYIHKINDFRSETLLFNVMSTYYIEELLEANVELIEDETIDIDNIEELLTEYSESGADTDIINYINDKIVPGIKQLNKRVKELESLNIEINEKDINEAINKAREQLNKEKSIKEK